MTRKDIEIGNNIICKFLDLGGEYDEHGIWKRYDFHSDWNMLMRALWSIEKLNIKSDILNIPILNAFDNRKLIFEEVVKIIKENG